MLNLTFLKKHAQISPNDKLLLSLSFAETIDQTDIAALLLGYEIDNAPIEFTMLLSYLHKRHRHITFPDEIVPRLEGLMRFFQHKNATLLCAFSEIGKQLNEKKIPVLLMKGIAMRYLRPNEPRGMWDVDFMVPEENYEEAIQTALDLGFIISEDIPLQEHSTDLHKGVAAIDIHRLFAKGVGGQWDMLKEMFSNAKRTTAFGVSVLVPRPEDLLLITLTNAYHNFMVNPGNYDGAFMGFFDCANIVKDNSSFDWDIVIATASKVGILYQIRTLLELMDWQLPSILPTDLFSKISLVEKEKDTDYSLKMDILKNEKRKLYYIRADYKCRSLRDVFFYLKLRINYRWLWSIRRIPLVRFIFLDTFIKFHKVS